MSAGKRGGAKTPGPCGKGTCAASEKQACKMDQVELRERLKKRVGSRVRFGCSHGALSPCLLLPTFWYAAF